MQNRIPLRLTDLLVVFFVFILMASAGICAVVKNRDAIYRQHCLENLQRLGAAISLYRSDNRQAFPQTVADGSDNPVPVWGTPYQQDHKAGPEANANPFAGGQLAPAANDVTASLFLLMRTERLAPSVLVCPSTELMPWDFGGGQLNAQDWTNWEGNWGLVRHLSYSFQNPFANKAAIAAGFQLKTPDSTFAIAADMNPGTPAVATVTPTSPEQDLRKANSLNHGSDGQNILYGDGHADWQPNIFAGTQHDNIFTAGGTELKEANRTNAAVAASPVSATDSILLPTGADIIPPAKPASDLPPISRADQDKLQASMQGNYTTLIDGILITMTIDSNTISYSTAADEVNYNYQILDGTSHSLLLKLTAPDAYENERATAELNDGELILTTVHDARLDYIWKRINVGK